jgi:TonB family protein
MFDTSIVRTRAAAAPRAALLTASVAVHSAAILAAVTLSIASSSFPNHAPDQAEIYRPTAFPVTPPPPLGTQAKARQPEPPKPQPKEVVVPPQPQPVTAPEAIPDQTPNLVAPAGGGADDAAAETPGVPWGKEGGVDVGQEFGSEGGTGTEGMPFQPGQGGVTFARVLTRVQPQFPQSMVKAIRSATVIVLCVIDKEGRIRDPKIVMSSYPPFNQSVLDALQQWTFAPGTLNGRPVDTYFELKVKFEVR